MFVETTNGNAKKKLANVFSHPSELKTSRLEFPKQLAQKSAKQYMESETIHDPIRSISPKIDLVCFFFASAIEVGGGKTECVFFFAFARFFGNRGMKWLLL